MSLQTHGTSYLSVLTFTVPHHYLYLPQTPANRSVMPKSHFMAPVYGDVNENRLGLGTVQHCPAGH